MIEYEEKSGTKQFVIFLIVSVIIHSLLFYFVPKIPTPKIPKSQKPISVRFIEEQPVKGKKKPPKKAHVLGKENITVKKETRPENKPKTPGVKHLTKHLPLPAPPRKSIITPRPGHKASGVKPMPHKVPVKPKYKNAKVLKPKVQAQKPSPSIRKSAKPNKRILSSHKKARFKVAKARPKRILPSPPPKEKPTNEEGEKSLLAPEEKHLSHSRSGRGNSRLTRKPMPIPAPKSLFPSPETLHQIERKFSHTYPPNVEKGDTISLNTRSFKYISYFTHIKRKIELVWEYPRLAVQLGEEGRLILRFTILKDGRLAGVKLIESSGYRLLDEEAIRAVKAAAPYPPIPDRLKKDHLNILANFTYTLGFKFVY